MTDYIVKINNINKNNKYNGVTKSSKSGKINEIGVQKYLDILNKTSVLAHEMIHAVFNILRHENIKNINKIKPKDIKNFLTNIGKYNKTDFYISLTKEEKEKICIKVQHLVYDEVLDAFVNKIDPKNEYKLREHLSKQTVVLGEK